MTEDCCNMPHDRHEENCPYGAIEAKDKRIAELEAEVGREETRADGNVIMGKALRQKIAGLESDNVALKKEIEHITQSFETFRNEHDCQRKIADLQRQLKEAKKS